MTDLAPPVRANVSAHQTSFPRNVRFVVRSGGLPKFPCLRALAWQAPNCVPLRPPVSLRDFLTRCIRYEEV